MRLVLAIAALASALPAAALAAGDRYGDRSPTASAAAIAAAYEGPTLSWSRKAQPAPPARQASPAGPSSPEPMALAGQFVRALPPAPTIRRGPEPQAYRPFQPQTPIPLQWSAPKAGLPGTLYDSVQPPAPAQQQIALAPSPPPAPRAQPARAAETGPVLLGGPPPQRLAAVAAAPRTSGGQTRLYSVHRGYGLEPDAIPDQPGGDRYVLIGPPDSGVQSPPEAEGDPDGRPGAF